MAVKGPAPLPYTLVAGADLRAMDYPVVALSGGKVALCNIASDVFIGILDTGVQKPNTNQHASVIFGPAITKARVGLAVTVDNYLTVQSGWLIPGQKHVLTIVGSGGSPSNMGSKDALVGVALETVASGGIATVLLYQTWSFINS